MKSDRNRRRRPFRGVSPQSRGRVGIERREVAIDTSEIRCVKSASEFDIPNVVPSGCNRLLSVGLSIEKVRESEAGRENGCGAEPSLTSPLASLCEDAIPNPS